jgi:hypothetical protein
MPPPPTMGLGNSLSKSRMPNKVLNATLKLRQSGSGSIRFTFLGSQQTISGAGQEKTWSFQISSDKLIVGTFTDASADLDSVTPASASQVIGSAAFDNDTSGDIAFTIDYSAISEGDTVQINYSLDS